MDKQNIAAISAMLMRAGFGEDIACRLLQHTCFNPVSFVMTERIQRNQDILICELHFERNGTVYICGYYDVALIKAVVIPERTINMVDLAAVDVSMSEIDWGMHQSRDQFLLNDERTWERERNIAQVVNQLVRLSATEEGKYFADTLKLKYWLDAGLENLVGNLNAIRARLEISQRVYFIDDDAIPVDEAYRFLLNKWIEKKIQAKKRERGKEILSATEATGGEGVEKGLMQKKRRTKIKRLK
ncbi:MAG: hypothetical protein HYU71_03885 [Bacteroidetes bacterium]|nr:hypothetical protein [Bacteroidota bacterium]